MAGVDGRAGKSPGMRGRGAPKALRTAELVADFGGVWGIAKKVFFML